MSFYEFIEQAFEKAFGITFAYRVEEPYPLLPMEEVDG